MKKKKSQKRQVFMIEAHPFKQQCIVVINGTFADVKKQLKKYGSEENLKHIEENKVEYDKHELKLGALFPEFPKGFAMIITVQPSWINTVGIVTHECLHLVASIARKVGLDFSPESEEAFTYLHQELTEQILAKIY